MNKKVIIGILSVVVFVFVLFFVFEVIPIIKEKESKTRVFKDMEKNSETAMRGIIGIIPESEVDGLSSYNGIGSGIIFDKEDNTYYAVTAKHVVDIKDNKLKIFTKDTKFSGQTVKADKDVNFEIPDDSYYESLLDGKVEYMSPKTDLAIVSFEYDGDLEVLEFETNKLKVDDKLMVIGHPEGNRYKVTYGYIKSDIKRVSTKDNNNKPLKAIVMEHDAYMKKGNSGGVALSKNMKIAGVNVAGSFTLLGHYRKGYMIPYDIVEENINAWRRM